MIKYGKGADIYENLFDSQIEAVKTIDEDLEIIACVGAGKYRYADW